LIKDTKREFFEIKDEEEKIEKVFGKE